MGSMSEEHEARLRRAFESYLGGETPSPLELANAPLLEDWSMAIVLIKRDAEELHMLPVLVGRVAGHPEHGDATNIETSQLVWLDRELRWARTWNRVYRLGERAGDEVDSGSEGSGA